jgi:hydrogenase large subunit
MVQKIVIDPVTRIEGHLGIEVLLDGAKVKEAKCSGTLFRGFEIFLKGRDPRDAQFLTQRVCGVCPIAHGIASTLNLDSAFGIADQIPDNGRILRNLIFGSNYLQSHILHFYHLAALDYVDVTAVADYDGADPALNSVKDFIARGALEPFVPRYEGDYRFDKKTNQELVRHYVMALEMRKLAQEMLVVFGGKMPHTASIVPGGCTEHPTIDKITGFLWRLNKIRDFIDTVYLPDVIAVAKKYPDHFSLGAGPGNYLSYGIYDLETKNPDYTKRKRFVPAGAVEQMKLKELDASKITESIKSSWYDGPDTVHPSQEDTVPNRQKAGAYSWLKSPRYEGKVYEVGPLARAVVSYLSGVEPVKKAVDGALAELKADVGALNSLLGRHAARALEAKIVADAMAGWVLELKPGEPVCADYQLPDSASGMGLTEAARGSVGHWIKIKDKKIDRYQLVVPTTWNASPRDEKGQPGPIEQALMNTTVKDANNPFELVRVVRSFDPCLACAIHVIDFKGAKISELRIG